LILLIATIPVNIAGTGKFMPHRSALQEKWVGYPRDRFHLLTQYIINSQGIAILMAAQWRHGRRKIISISCPIHRPL